MESEVSGEIGSWVDAEANDMLGVGLVRLEVWE